MREKAELLSRVLDNAEKASSPQDIELIHGLAQLEILIDIRDILAADMKTSLEISKAMSKRERT